MLSILEESEPVVLTISSSLAISGRRSLTKFALREFAQPRLASMVLISPLCASRRNGCANGQRGAVLVEKR